MTVTHRGGSAPPLGGRAELAVRAMTWTNRLSRYLGRGSGTVAGGRVGLALDPDLLSVLATGRRVALVSGTNGKTTTTRMVAAAVTGDGRPPVVSNQTGANMPAGHVAALAGAPAAGFAVLEVDEGYLARLLEETAPRVVVLLNLSRDQLDRIAEVRMLADRWRLALGSLSTGGAGGVVVANADDPMVVHAALGAPRVRWVGAGQVWPHDAAGCPSCGGRIQFDPGGGWACEQCTLARPEREAWLDGSVLVTADGSRRPVDLALPGQFNRANAAMAAVGAVELCAGDGPEALSLPTALQRVSTVREVAGRFASTLRGGHPVRLLLAKNPAGWTAVLDLLDESEGGSAGAVLSVNARVADGFDPSWLWDVPFERLAGRPVVVTGERRLDVAVRLRYAGVDCTVVADPLAAVDRAVGLVGALPAGSSGPASVDVIANYTAFAELRACL